MRKILSISPQKKEKMTKPSIVFFGTSEFAIYILNELEQAGFLPDLIVSTPDKPQGRKLILTPPPVKEWATKRNIEVLQPTSLKKEPVEEILRSKAPAHGWDIFIVASYGKIIPEAILDIPTHKTLNVHPSLLPKLRGPSPIESAILNDEKHTGITIMRLDAEMDHGPIIIQKHHEISEWPKRELLEKDFGEKGGKLLADLIPEWILGNMNEQEQNHSEATYCQKIEKAHAEIDLHADPYLNFRKIQAYSGWPKAYFFLTKGDKKIRIVISEAEYVNDELIITKVIPEGKSEMQYADFLRGYDTNKKE